jgi:hypothetical protein
LESSLHEELNASRKSHFVAALTLRWGRRIYSFRRHADAYVTFRFIMRSEPNCVHKKKSDPGKKCPNQGMSGVLLPNTGLLSGIGVIIHPGKRFGREFSSSQIIDAMSALDAVDGSSTGTQVP